MGLDAVILVFWMLTFKPAISPSSFTFLKRLFFTFFHKGGVKCISEVVDISTSNLDCSLCFIQPGILSDVFCISFHWLMKCLYLVKIFLCLQISIQFSLSVMSDSLRPPELQHARPPCPSPTPGAHPNPCPLSWWCHPTISSSVIAFSSWPQSFWASGSFQMSQHFASGGQSIGVSASTSVLPMNTQDRSPLGWTVWISMQSKGLSRSLIQHHSSEASIFPH